ncbi:MAG: hypothetical protein ACOCUI_00925 [bacterium]
MNKKVILTREQFRNIMLDALKKIGCLKDNQLGSGYIDWHTDDNQCGLTVTLINGEKFSITVEKEMQ